MNVCQITDYKCATFGSLNAFFEIRVYIFFSERLITLLNLILNIKPACSHRRRFAFMEQFTRKQYATVKSTIMPLGNLIIIEGGGC